MRPSKLAGFAALCLAFAARADDTKPPQISEVKAGVRGAQVQVEARITDDTGVLSATCHHRTPGGKVDATPMIKSDLDDTFRASFGGGPETEYWIEASDLLGNGPSTYGSASKAFAVGTVVASGKAVAAAEPPRKKAKREPAPRTVAKASEPPTIQHSRPPTPPPEGREFTVRSKIRSDSPVAVAVLQARPQGTAAFTNTPLTRAEGDTWEAQIPASMAKGTVEYFIAAKNQAGQMTRQGDGDAKTPYTLSFKGSGAVTAVATAPQSARPSGPYTFTDDPPARVVPGRPFLVRAQVVPSTDSGEMPDRVAVLWRGSDGQDQLTDMVKDETGGWGGFKAELPPQDEGAVFYQVVACDAAAAKCGVDTGSKRKWHATAIASQAGAARPLPLDAVSAKAPPSLPE
jgi:hypothetical protein